MRKKRKDLVDQTIRKIIYIDNKNEYVELQENSRKYLKQQYERNVKYNVRHR